MANKTVYIGTGSRWGNNHIKNQTINTTRYEAHIKRKLELGTIQMEDLADLYTKDLICFCGKYKCHKPILEKLSEWAVQQLVGV